ncbi:MAG TPA: DUF58 domain-containing protein [Candidatus Paceibacterota bacterium]|nr:DUF58 domain-containing protein [Verrucomicrobiota bacterium]HRY49645.1 DUF58 domain-containing protein [Candidatus Paceibacterota bacterium]HSA00698.1 DUF58 domain-containing protein [Candidatus Paceibacterota bacterium]
MLRILDILEQVRRIELRANRLVNDTMVGAYLSFFRGRGLDFEELREYIPGDDVRDIDWNVTYRLGRPFVKKFREERELGVVLAVDISASSQFGSQGLTKREFAVEVAATLAFSAAKSCDKAGLLLFTDRTELFLPPRKGRRHLLRIIREMLAFQAHHAGTDIPSALGFLNHALPRRSLVFLFTDFLHSFENETRNSVSRRDMVQEIGLTNARHDLVCVHLCDPREQNMPDAGLLTLEDIETGELVELDSARGSVRDQYARFNASRLATLDRALRRAGVDTLRLNITEPYAQVLQHFFEHRRWR